MIKAKSFDNIENDVVERKKEIAQFGHVVL